MRRAWIRTLTISLGLLSLVQHAVAQQEVIVAKDSNGVPGASIPATIKNRLTVRDKDNLCGKDLTLAPAAGSHADGGAGVTVFDISGMSNGAKVALMCKGKSLGEFSVESAPTSATLPDCSGTDVGDTFYSRDHNEAIFVVDLFGRVVERPELVVDEDDTVIVRVVAPADRLGSIVVRRASQTRIPVESRVVGMEKEAARIPETLKPQPCKIKDYRLGDFQPGEGKFEIVEKRETDGKLDETVRGTVTFTVTPLYTGYFSFAALATRAADPTFAIVHSGDKRIISAGDVQDWSYRYVVFFTPYLWKRRDIEKGPDRLWHRINPSIGVALKDFSDNVFLGLSTDLGTGSGLGLSILGGVHFAHIHELDPNAGLTVGGEFHGDAAATVPTTQRWTGKLFLAVGFDVRAILGLIKLAAGVK